MIIAKPIGGLGNQMFAYAAGLALARRTGADLRIDASAYETYKTWPYHLDKLCIPQNMAPKARASRLALLVKLAEPLRRFLPRLFSGMPTYREPHFHYDPNFEKLTSPVALEGYFQSCRYFTCVEEELREQFQPSEALSEAAQKTANLIEQAPCAVSLHVRRGDYLSAQANGVHGVLGLDYYRRAIAHMQAQHGAAIFFLFSDDPDWVKAHIGAGIACELVHGDPSRPWEDMALMARCDHHIIANSSFSWWGAWLNPSPNKLVIAPRRWFATDSLRTDDLIPKSWVLL
ncbi:MAG TPA: alpha-1,2-fucosyltransferase [Oxalobacteraceae bacterium]|nr:alpha-1,2-fucosyltransferase [Oxalobacteraceae bacterium]